MSHSTERWIVLALAMLLCSSGCVGPPTGTSAPGWLARDRDAQALQLERQLRGMDVAMVETGYRYIELYWAGRDGNWDAATYQIDKIRLAIENGIERRPKRAAAAQPFLVGSLAAMREAAVARDARLFGERFESLTAACNACHAMEKVAFFEVSPPEVRVSPIRPAAGADAEE